MRDVKTTRFETYKEVAIVEKSVVNSFKAAPTVLRILISTSFVPKNVTVCPTAQLFSVTSRAVPLRVNDVFTMS